MRRLVLLLLTVNACYLLWSVLTPDSPAVSPVAWPDEVSSLQLLPPDQSVPDTEEVVRDDVLATSVSGTAGSDPAAVLGRCWRIGPFTSSELRSSFVRSRLADVAVAIIEQRQESAGGWRVFLPPADDRAAASALRESFRSAAAEAGEELDSYVMTEGERANAVSLGLFSQEQNARNLQSRVASFGMDARLEQEISIRTVEWVELFASREWMNETRRSGLAAYAPDLRVTENLCQMIAPEPDFP
ncbi:MAG: hypothetical protein ACQETO_10310 [Pseudomonadota bacterium]